MIIATINVNGIRAAIRRGMPGWLEQRQPDVVLLQELRAPDDVVRHLLREHLGSDWHIAHTEAAAKGRAGVAIASRYPHAAVRTELPLPDGGNEPEGDAGRWIEADLQLPSGRSLTVASAYLYSGTAGTPSMDAKYAHLDRVTHRLAELARSDNAVIGGDINIGHSELDIRNWKGNRKNAGFLPEERAYLDRWYGSGEGDLGLVDTGRRVAGRIEGPYTWWSWRGKAYDNDSGWRIDVQAATPALAERVTDAWVDRADTYDSRFSDHAPFVVTYQD